MSKPAEIAAMVAAAEKEFGAVDILCNNAGIQHVAPVDEFPLDKWDAIIAINLSASFHAIRAALPGMKSKKWGRIINTASRARAGRLAVQGGLCRRQARHRRPDQDGRAGGRPAWDHGQWHLPRLRLDAAGREPDPRHDEGAQHDREQVKSDVMLAAQPTKEFVTAEQVASLAVYLCSDGARKITGALLLDGRRLDGGVTDATGRYERAVTTDEARFRELVVTNPVIATLIERLPALGTARLLARPASALMQTVWNALEGRDPGDGIRDYDVFYFDPDLSWEAEDRAIRRAAVAFADIDATIEVRNQARVHLWFDKRNGTSGYPLLTSARHGIDVFLATPTMLGMHPTGDGAFDVYAPRGFGDLFNFVFRPNPEAIGPADGYARKAAERKARYPKLTVIPWRAVFSEEPT